ncbi:MAG: PD40 domain-containing protein [Cyclobacteriaceae bacterium]
MRNPGLTLLLSILPFSCYNSEQKQTTEKEPATTNQVNLFLPGTVSTFLPERDLAISPNGNEIYFTVQSFKKEVSTILRIQKTGQGWSEPTAASFSGKYMDLEPAFTPDGSRLFFASKRPLKDTLVQDYNIWYVERIETGWSEAQDAGEAINSEKDEYYPSIARNGSIYFTAAYEDSKGTEDIYCSEFVNGEYQKPYSLDSAVNAKTYEFNAFVDPDEKYLLFGSYGRADGFGGGDIYISYNENGKWQEAINLGSLINSKSLDYCPYVSRDGKTLYFTSSKSDIGEHSTPAYDQLRDKLQSPLNGFDNIYQVDFQEVLEEIK